MASSPAAVPEPPGPAWPPARREDDDDDEEEDEADGDDSEDPDYDPMQSARRRGAEAELEPAAATGNDIAVGAGPEHFRRIVGHLHRSYAGRSACDASILCGSGEGATSVPCHGLVLAALSPSLAEALGGGDGFRGDEADPAVIIAPDLDPKVVSAFLDDVYAAEHPEASWVSAAQMAELESLAKALGLSEDVWGALLQVVVKKEKVEVEPSHSYYDEAYYEDDDYEDYKEYEIKREVKPERKRRGRPPKSSTLSKASPPKRAKFNPAKVSKETLENIRAQVERMDELLQRLDGSEEIAVEMQPLKRDDSSTKHLLGAQNHFMAILGMQTSEPDGVSLASPVIWSRADEPDGSTVLRMFQQYSDALIEVMGMSLLEIYGQQAIRIGMGMKRQGGTRRNSIRQDFASYTPEKLREVLAREDISKAGHRKPCKTESRCLNLYRRQKMTFKLVPDSKADNFEALVLVCVDGNGKLCGFPCLLDASSEKVRDLACQDYVKLFFRVVLARTDQDAISHCHSLLQNFDVYLPLKLRYDAAVEFLSDESAEKRKSMMKEEQCPDCGEVFSIRTTADKAKFSTHKRNHFYMNYKCDCAMTWDSLNAKRSHVMLVHMPGNVQCQFCSYVAGPKAVASHVYSFHTDMTCEHCGAVLGGAERLNEHLQRIHPEHLSEKLKRRKNPGGTCDHCGEHFTNLNKHIRLMHTQTEPIECPHCGITFKENKRLKMHVLNVHTPKELLPFACDHCDRKFASKGLLTRHIESFHIKARHMVCRYEGCDAAYNDFASRCNHEKMKHGDTFPRAVKKGLVPPRKTRDPHPQIPVGFGTTGDHV